MRVAGLLLLGFLAVGHATQSPVTKVVELIEELKSKIEADAISEQKVYDKYACWCETTTARKATAIEDAKVSIEKLGHSVLSLKGKSATEGSEIAEANANIASNENAQAKATAIREKENADYQANKAEMENTIGALEKAVTVLSGAGTKGELLQKKDMALLEVGLGVRNAVQALPDNAKLSEHQLSLLSSFMKDPQDYYEDKAAAKSSYSPASTTIMGILKDMYDTFTANLETETQTEATNQKNFEAVMAVKAEELASLQALLEKTEAAKGETDKTLADTTQELEDTTVQMKEDTAFFDDTKAACKTKADEWAERTRLRTQELAGINKALEVLTSDESRALFNKAIKPGKETFLQIDAETSAPGRAFKALKQQAGKLHSLRLASLAATVGTATRGNFGVVVDEVDKMIQVLKDEEQEDIDQRDWCKETTFVKETEASRYAYKIEKTEAHLTKMNEKKSELEDAIVATDAEILATQEELAAMEAQRTADNGAYLQAKSDDEAAAGLLGVAIGHLSAFYDNESIDQGEIQGSINLLQKRRQPEFEVSEDQAPDATFSSGDKSAGESKGIVSIMTMLKEDLEDEVKNGIAAEEAAQTEYQTQRDAGRKLIASLEEKKTNLNDAKADTDDKINDAERVQADTQGQLDGRNEELAAIKPNCDWILKNFDLRRDRRKGEMEGLMEAKSLLSGSGGTVLVQTQKHDVLSFEGVSFLQKRQ